MRSFVKYTAITATLMASTSLATAADMIEPPVVEVIPEVHTVGVGGWYLRGDIGYAKMSTSEVDYYQGTPTLTGSFEKHDISDTWMIGGGIGYQVTDYFRFDVTANHYAKTHFDGSSATGVTCGAFTCDYEDDSEVGVTTIMANAYVDLGNYAGFTPYVGAGIGGAKVHWADVENRESCVSADCTGYTPNNSDHSGHGGDWRFAYALHAGMSYDLSHNMKLDAGYTFTHVEGGRMFNFESGSAFSGQQGFDGGIKIHAVRAGIRWHLH